MTTAPRPTRRLAPRLAALAALAVLLVAGGCRSTGAEGKRERWFSKVRPPVAFEMLRDTPGMPVIDLRTRFEFTGPIGHVKGARNVPLEELRTHLLQLAPIKDRTFLLYCGHGDCGEEGLEILLRAGFREAILMDGGIDAWVMSGFGTVTGPPPPMSFPDEDSQAIAVD
ncbi:MAG TPA: rhodanese-like domain-containing protein [Thermoanaerobaculia bacterium]|nr:rhodanese-like domain-containing protein [Thermoanaerobaculia bacterium]